MGHVNTQITLKNVRDIFNAEDGIIQEPEIRQATIDVMVDTGATMLVINEQIYKRLGLRVAGEREISLANDAKETCKLTEPLEINWEDRSFTMPALVMKDASEFLLGVLPLEGMDLMVDTVNQRLVGAHGDHVLYRAKKSEPQINRINQITQIKLNLNLRLYPLNPTNIMNIPKVY